MKRREREKVMRGEDDSEGEVSQVDTGDDLSRLRSAARPKGQG